VAAQKHLHLEHQLTVIAEATCDSSREQAYRFSPAMLYIITA
jgi:hypothetical protein